MAEDDHLHRRGIKHLLGAGRLFTFLIVFFSILTLILTAAFIRQKKLFSAHLAEDRLAKYGRNPEKVSPQSPASIRQKKMPLLHNSAQERPDDSTAYYPERPSSVGQLLYLETPLVYYPDSRFPKLTTPMWIGEPGVRAAVILSIDDLGDVDAYEKFLRPILQRLKKIENGKSPFSILATRVNPGHPLLQQWLNEGLTIEAHTSSHSCPLLHKGNFKKSLNDFISCVDHLFSIPHNAPLAFRMPCCDSQNSVSPRFYAHIFSRLTPHSHSLQVDSSIFLLLTPEDAEIPKSKVADPEGKSIFRKYIPSPKYVNYIVNYPYPYLIHNAIWEFPCIIPSDWQGLNCNGPVNSRTLSDLKLALDAVVAKEGVFVLCLHPHGWINSQQVVELIDYAVTCYEKKVKFLNFKDAYTRIVSNLLEGMPLRSPRLQDHGIRLIDINNDMHLDVVIGHPEKKATRIWNPFSNTWTNTLFPASVVDRAGRATGIKFLRIQKNGFISFLLRNEKTWAFHSFDGKSWEPSYSFESLFPQPKTAIFSSFEGRDRGLRVVDFNRDGFSDLVYNNEGTNCAFLWDPEKERWIPSSARLPRTGLITDETGLDRGHRFVDLNGDGHPDSVCSNEKEYWAALYTDEQKGWSEAVISGKHSENAPDAIPPIVEGRRLAGAWFRGSVLYLQNERTGDRQGQVLKYIFPFSSPLQESNRKQQAPSS